ncbi:ergothioneine biosynthesis protein EgtB [Aliidiomarina sp. Khilg15.8]
MPSPAMQLDAAVKDATLLTQYQTVRAQSLALTEFLSEEDMMLQSMPDASPTKWHLAHTTWFFETFLLQPHLANYHPFDADYQYLFNSYYDTVGERHPRPLRGLLSRPSLSQVIAYRAHVDSAMKQLLQAPTEEIAAAVTIGLHHEMQHQELISTDIKHALSLNPHAVPDEHQDHSSEEPLPPARFIQFAGGLTQVGTDAQSEFAYDCEQPRHKVYIPEFSLSNRLVTNQEWLEFINAGGYQNPKLWLSDGWAICQQEGWQAPLYWVRRGDAWFTMSHSARHPVNPQAPVCHISYYEADAFARWCGCRLPTEFEWEFAASALPIEGNFLESGHKMPQPASAQADDLQQMFGDAWEWTQSPFTPYPGFTPPQGALAEYNGKFMANQWVLRGGSCATAQQQMRTTYRNFFYAHQRWQFSSLRLAK